MKCLDPTGQRISLSLDVHSDFGAGSVSAIIDQRFPSRLAFAVALAWIGVSPRCASTAALVETFAMLIADWPSACTNAACRVINWIGVRLLANDMNAALLRRAWRQISKPQD